MSITTTATMTDEELEVAESNGGHPLDFCEDARDGLEELGALVVRLVQAVRAANAEARDANAVCGRWKVEARGIRTIREAVAAKCEYMADVVVAHDPNGSVTWKQLLGHIDAWDESGRAFVEDVIGAAVRLVGVQRNHPAK